jgi:hypothetical protein
MLSPNLEKQWSDLCYSVYPKRITASLIDNDDGFLTFLAKNRLDHCFALKYKTNKELLYQYEEYKKKIIASLRILKRNLAKKSFLVIKTFSSYPHTTSDLDIIVKDESTAQKNNKLQLLIPYDINHKISWTNDEEMSHNFIWNNAQEYDFHGIKVLIPNPALDVLIRTAHLPFEQAELRLGELLHIYKQSKKIQWEVLDKEAVLNGWGRTFRQTKNLFDSLHKRLFKKTDSIHFPYRLSSIQLAQAVVEKKAWSKIWGARYIIKDRLFNSLLKAKIPFLSK